MLNSTASFRQVLRTTGSLAVVFLAAAWMADVRVATVLVAGLIACGLNQLFVVRSLRKISQGVRATPSALLFGAIGLLISIIIVSIGYWPMFVMLAGGVFLIDAVVLRFR